MKTSRGVLSACATSNATGTPPRGSARTSTSWRLAYFVNSPASTRPASRRSANSMVSNPRSCALSRPDAGIRASMQMPPEPFAGKASDFLQRPGFLEEMRRSRYDPKLLLAPKERESFLVQFDDRFVQAADDEQSWRLDAGERVCGEVRPPSARNNGADFVA